MFQMPFLRKLSQLIRMGRKQMRTDLPTQDRVIYEERIFSRNITFMFLAIAFLFLFLAERFDADMYLPIKGQDMLLPFFLMLAIAVNFSVLKVKITLWGLFLRFGILHYETPWGDIQQAYIPSDGIKGSVKGWGITLTSIEEGMRLSYSVPGKPKVVCQMKSDLFNEVAFSTSKPEIALTALKEGIGRSVGNLSITAR